MEFLVEFELNVPVGSKESDVTSRKQAEASAAATLASEGHLVRVWKLPVASGEDRILGLYRAESANQLNDLLTALPLYQWMQVVVTPLEPHPNDPAKDHDP